jgi:hypothetical protein
MMGKAYANRKKEIDRPESDFYATPRPLTWELMKLGLFDSNKNVYEPACGDGAIVEELNKYFKNGFLVGDIRENKYHNQEDFLTCSYKNIDYIISNPPFSMWNDFILKAKEVATDKIAFIGKTNFFGVEGRNRLGIWKNLSDIYIFNRMVDYRYFREDNKIICGNLVTAWFIWDMNWNEDYWRTHIIDIQKYVLRRDKVGNNN